MNQLPVFSVSDFVAIINQVIEMGQPVTCIKGEVSNFKISKNRWVYFDLKDETSKVRCFGTTMQLPMPIEDGMLVQIIAQPYLHHQYGFTLNIISIELSGEGTLYRAIKLLEAKLEKEGLFNEARKRLLPYPPTKIALIASKESAAYKDFIKVINARWGGIEIFVFDVHVQGSKAPNDIVKALETINTDFDFDAIVVTRGGGSADDLQAFSNEAVVRAVASSRTPTLVAIGHEIDFSLAERAADVRASTPSNAAELLVPDKNAALRTIKRAGVQLKKNMFDLITAETSRLDRCSEDLSVLAQNWCNRLREVIEQKITLLDSFNPTTVLRRGYAMVSKNGQSITGRTQLEIGDTLKVTLQHWDLSVKISEKVKRK